MLQRSNVVRIAPLQSVERNAALLAALDRIMFESSATRTFATPAEQARFRERWLGRYLDRHPEHAFLALTAEGRAAGYLVGAIEDPALDPHWWELSYTRDFAPLTARFPAHLHINLAPQFRSLGIGVMLIEAFADHASRHGAAGVHVVTGAQARNVGFYLRNGFAPLAHTAWNGRPLVLLGRPLAPDAG